MATSDEHLGRLARQFLEQQDIAAGEDWDPLLFVRQGDDLLVSDFPGRLLNSPQSKDMLIAVCMSIVVDLKATDAVLAMSAWMVRADEGEERNYSATHPVSQDPRRVEALVVMCWLESGDSTWIAEIARDAAGKPSLGRWEQLAGVLESRFEPLGRMVARQRS